VVLGLPALRRTPGQQVGVCSVASCDQGATGRAERASPADLGGLRVGCGNDADWLLRA
jgi:hypothetical protein